MTTESKASPRLRRRYTRILKVGSRWNTYLKIDDQSFYVVEQTSRARARWFADMLAIALERLIRKEKNGPLPLR